MPPPVDGTWVLGEALGEAWISITLHPGSPFTVLPLVIGESLWADVGRASEEP